MKLTLFLNGDITGSCGKGEAAEIMREKGKLTKSYVITNTDYRIILSAAVNLVNLKKYKIVFLTHTFPFDPNEKTANSILKMFFKTIKREYNVQEYIWTKERQKTGRIHYHSLIDMPFIPIKDLQNIWNHCINYYQSDIVCSVNSLRFPLHNAVIYNSEITRTVRYIAKYITKERGKSYKQPCYAITKALYQGIKREISDNEAIELIKKYGIHSKNFGEYWSVTRLKTFKNEKK